GDQLTYRAIASLKPQVARVETVRLDRNKRLRDEPLLHLKRAQCCLAPGGIAVEGEDDLSAIPVSVYQQPAQDLDVTLAEGGSAGGHRGRDARQVAGHHVGVALDDDRLTPLG